MDEVGKALLEDINKTFQANIPITDETTQQAATVFNKLCEDCDEKQDCNNCDERMGEPMRNEGRD